MGTGKKWQVAKIGGIPIYISMSWLVIVALYIYVTYTGLTGGALVTSEAEALMLSVLAASMFFGSVLIHEGAHAVVARAYRMPVHGITLVFWGGATETRASARGPLAEFLVSFVGPAATLIMAVAFAGLATLTQGVVSAIARNLAEISLVFAVLNALPGFPLDGGRMLLAAAWGISRSRRTGLVVAAWGGIVVGIGLLAAAVWSLSQQTGWWLFLGYVGFLLVSTGRGLNQQLGFRDELGRGRARDAMREPSTPVPADMTLSQALDLHLRDHDGQVMPVVDQGRVIGTVSFESARKVGARNPMRPVRDGMSPLDRIAVLEPDQPLDEVLEHLQITGGRDGLVLQDGQLLGMIGPADVERWYRREIQGIAEVPTGSPNRDWIPPRPDI
jgi:Zn-dependent protease/predicted transcriptional regulator